MDRARTVLERGGSLEWLRFRATIERAVYTVSSALSAMTLVLTTGDLHDDGGGEAVVNNDDGDDEGGNDEEGGKITRRRS